MRVLPVLALAALLAAPAAAQVPLAPATASLTIEGLPSGVREANATTHVIDLQVTLTLANLFCAGQGNLVFPVTLEAAVNGTATAEPKPATLEFQVPAGVQTIQGYSQTLPATLVVNRAGDVGDATTAAGTVTATLNAASSGCVGNGTPTASASGNYTVQFNLPPGVAPKDRGEQMPGPAFGLLALAIAALAMARRSK